MTNDDTLTCLIALASRVAGPERTPQGAGSDTPLMQAGFWLDSVGLLELVVACEAEFQVAFDPERDLTVDALATIGSFAAVVEAKLAR